MTEAADRRSAETLAVPPRVVSVVFAAGKGTRMTGYDGNKTLLPLLPTDSPFQGARPLLHEVLSNLPSGPKILVVNHRKEDVISATEEFEVSCAEQPVTNGTGGALLAARPLLMDAVESVVLITMGDVPLVRRKTYEDLVDMARYAPLVVLGFRPSEPARYGAVEMSEERVRRITEWAYWKDYSPEKRAGLTIFNSGIYAAQRDVLLEMLPKLERNPHVVHKERNGRVEPIEEFFITDLVELMVAEGMSPNCVVCADEREVMGVDTPEALRRVQEIYRKHWADSA